MDPFFALAASWDPLETTFYTSSLLYSLSTPSPSTSAIAGLPPFPASLSAFYVAHSQLSGSIALLRNSSVPVPYGRSATTLKGVGIYSSSGIPITRFSLDDAGDEGPGAASTSQRPPNFSHPVLFDFTRKGQLVVLEEGGRFRVYKTNSADFSSHSLAGPLLAHPSAQQAPVNEGLLVTEAKSYGGGFVVRTNTGTFFDVPLEGGRPVPLSSPPALSPGTVGNANVGPKEAWCVMGPDEAPLGVTTVYLSRGKTVYTLDRDEWVDQRIDKGPFLSVLPSPSGRLLALLVPPSSASGFPSLWVVSSTFAQSHSTLSPLTLLGTESTPAKDEGWTLDSAQWCANDSVVISWSWPTIHSKKAGSKVVVCGPGGGYLNYPSSTSEPPVMLPTSSGLSVLEPGQHRFISTVSHDLQQLVLAVDPEPPTAILIQAYEHFTKGNPKSYGLLTKLREEGTLKEGVRTLVEIVKGLTSSDEEEGELQKRILSAAKWARGFLDELDREGDEGIVEIGQGLRVLNALRSWDVGIPLSWNLYKETDSQLLLSILTSRFHHLLALRLSQFLHLPPAPILEHWAKSVVKSTSGGGAGGEGDAQLVKRIKSKLGKGKGGVYESVAREAWKAGRRGLALNLLDLESRMDQGVDLLLSMREDQQALDKAVKSGDTDLVYHTLLTLKSRLALGDFFKLVDDSRTAGALLECYARDSEDVNLDGKPSGGGKEREMLKDFYWQDDRRLEGGLLALEEGALATDTTERLAFIKLAGKTFGEDRDLGFESKMMDDYHRLLSLQETFEKESDPQTHLHLVGLSVNETITELIKKGLAKKADRVRGDFKVPDRRFYFIKLHALTAVKDWPSLEAFAKLRKSPIGYEPFVAHLVEKGHLKEGAKYVPRCEQKNRVDLYVKCGEWSKAAMECKERNDKTGLERLRAEAPTTLIKREVEAVLSTLSR